MNGMELPGEVHVRMLCPSCHSRNAALVYEAAASWLSVFPPKRLGLKFEIPREEPCMVGLTSE